MKPPFPGSLIRSWSGYRGKLCARTSGKGLLRSLGRWRKRRSRVLPRSNIATGARLPPFDGGPFYRWYQISGPACFCFPWEGRPFVRPRLISARCFPTIVHPERHLAFLRSSSLAAHVPAAQGAGSTGRDPGAQRTGKLLSFIRPRPRCAFLILHGTGTVRRGRTPLPCCAQLGRRRVLHHVQRRFLA